MRIFFDTEFIERGSKYPIMPISIGMVREDDTEYYAEFDDVDWDKASDWVMDNVKPYLNGDSKSRSQIIEEIKEFVGATPEFWAYYADYDWVLLCQLFGRMIDLPQGWPFFCLDIKQYMWHWGLSIKDIPIINKQEHNALADAHWNKETFDFVLEYQKKQIES